MDSQESSPTPQFKSINSLALSFPFSPTLISIHDYFFKLFKEFKKAGWEYTALKYSFPNLEPVYCSMYSYNPTIELPELTQDWGKRLLEGTNKTLWAPGPRRKEQWPHERLTQSCPWGSRSLRRRHGSAVACCRVGGTECSSEWMGPFEGGRHYLYYLHHSLASGHIRERKTALPINKKLDWTFIEHGPAHQYKTQFPPHLVFPIKKVP